MAHGPTGPASRERQPLEPAVAGLLTFLAAASVLVLEIAAGRLLAPYVGVSLTTYTGIIGVILAGIALGAWAGGKAADRFGPERLLGPTLIAGGWAAIAAVPIVAIVGGLDPADGVLEIVLLAAVGFVVPATILSAVGPMIVRATLVELSSAGSIVGGLSAIGTVGAITGTFLTGFVLLGLVPTRAIILGVGAILVVTGLAVTWWLTRSLAGVLVGLVASLVLALSAVTAPNPCTTESAYYCVALIEDPNDPDRRSLVLDGLWHASVDVADPSVLVFAYVRRFIDASAGPIEDRGGTVDALHIGGGEFTIPRYLTARYPASRHTVLELDPAILAIAVADLGLTLDDRLGVELGDARLSIVQLADDTFDVAYGDAFGGLAVPWHLTTREFIDEVDRVLRPDGLYVLNVIDYPPLGFARAELATLAAVFEHVAVVAPRPTLAGAEGSNLVLVASHAPIDSADIEARLVARVEDSEWAVLADPMATEAFVSGATVLTDDFAPVDQLLGR